MPRLQFTDHEATMHRATVVSLDLAGFSNFCNQSEPSVAITVPGLIKRTFDSLNEFFNEEDESNSIFPKDDGKLPQPRFIKYTGDGALMFWLCPPKEQFSQQFCNFLVESMRSFQVKLSSQLPEWEKEWRIRKLPKKVRVGIATGIVYALRPPHSFTSLTDPCDYVGYCINLAVRLQSYCPALGFLVHGNLHSKSPGMRHLTAINLKGTQEEPVAVFREDMRNVSPADLKRKFLSSE
jgi:class 3 adenylate cyclase